MLIMIGISFSVMQRKIYLKIFEYAKFFPKGISRPQPNSSSMDRGVDFRDVATKIYKQMGCVNYHIGE